jgi:hypothetical protein
MVIKTEIVDSSFFPTTAEQNGSNYCPDEIIIGIFIQCLCMENNFQGASALSITNSHIYTIITRYMSQLDLRVVCPKLTILDAKALGCIVNDEPNITFATKCKVIAYYHKVAPYIEGNQGLTLLTMPKGCSLNSICTKGVEVMGRQRFFVYPRLLEKIGSDSVEKTYRVLITDNVFKENGAQGPKEYVELAFNAGFTLPTALELIALSVSTYQVPGRFECFKEALFNMDGFQLKAMTIYGQTCTKVGTKCFMAGYCFSVRGGFSFNCAPVMFITPGSGGKVNL